MRVVESTTPCFNHRLSRLHRHQAPGDIIAMPSEDGDGFGCSLAVALDNGRVLGLNSASGLIEPMIPHLFICAWRV